MKKIFLIGCGVVVLSVVVMVILVLTNNNGGSKELVCESNMGNITITYNNATVIGYTAKDYSYDLLAEKARAEEIGINKYINEFSNTFNTNTFGTCTK